MSLPEILQPAGTPTFLSAGHAHARRTVGSNVQRGTGHSRKRRMRTTAPQTVDVSWFLNDVQAQAVYSWFESTLVVISKPFSARIASLGSNTLSWWSASWVAPPTWTSLGLNAWLVSGQLLLTGDASFDPPESTSARAEFRAALIGAADAVIDSNASVEFEAALTVSSLASVEFSAPLAAVIQSWELREDGGTEFREDGGIELRN